MVDRTEIQAVLRGLSTGDLLEGATGLLETLGYASDRTLADSGDPRAFFADSPSTTESRHNLLDKAKVIRLIFQVTDEEIRSGAGARFMEFDGAGFDQGRTDCFLFVAVELRDEWYARSTYAGMTREINRAFEGAPAVVLFRAGRRLTMGFAGRRAHQRDAAQDVVQEVNLIKDIKLATPHRAHIDTLAELSLPAMLAWMDAHDKPHNFDGLLTAWLAILSTEELNKRFYKELFGWFQRAVNEAKFPRDKNKTLPKEEHIIRLITRLMFIWFIKEKGLVAGDIFVETRVRHLLKGYDPAAGDSWYRAVLQNLFFATLNTEIGKRRFSTASRTTHRVFSLYRYKDLMAKPDELMALFEKTPFINGGLFECLDSGDRSQTAKGYRIDCFSDNLEHRAKLSVPNRLFFDEKGLIPIFERYRFTVEENTPVEQEVALDPELLGKVFENLLAAYNPETRETVRKQTGSYYTPRPVVNYMVRETVAAALAEKLKAENDKATEWRERLAGLVDETHAFGSDDNSFFDDDKRQSVVRRIADLTVLDPAVGSGAFPMAVLHALTLALRRLDPDNHHWEQVQRDRAGTRARRAFDTSDDDTRGLALKEIDETFKRYRDSDFGRKLYLIQNTLFGVDIQPIACQIVKLRFFISLAIEQQATKDSADNYGIRPLPNLETRFLAANTLLGTAAQRNLRTGEQDRIEGELRENREQHFNATTWDEKTECRKIDEKLRTALTTELVRNAGLSGVEARKIAAWDPYDQNSVADWFDPEYMFGINDGFDVVIGNPPYIQLQKNGGQLGQFYRNAGYQTFASTGDIYQLFYEKGCQLLKPARGLLAYITSNSWLKAEYGKRLRGYFSGQHTPLRLLEMGKDVFDNAIVDTSILIAREGRESVTSKAVDMDRLPDKTIFPPAEHLWGELRPRGEKPWSVLSSVEQGIMDKMEKVGTPLKEWDIAINYGIKTGYNRAFIIDNITNILSD